jgi:hypothetical protein
MHPSVGCAAPNGRPTGMTGRNDHPRSTFSEAPLTESCESLEAFESLVGYTDHMREDHSQIMTPKGETRTWFGSSYRTPIL